ncbi:TlyA family RNA methyltransferase [Tepidicaulis sp. LMO-SS28]|uniref:TlyA family RNA methyltransferase n=1 Tax=Tepidicaulis sp. LMO-SS28 TaxID=3447455 RepID=UPI003EE0F3F0
MTGERERLDLALVTRGLAPSRARAQALLKAGKVLVNGAAVSKASQTIGAADALQLSEPDHPWVSRAALKLVAGLDHFGMDVAGKVALDVGASTGGFSQVLRARGARLVYAVDVGHDQLAPPLREDEGVVSLEGVNARDLSAVLIPERPEIIVSDVSFISLEKALPAALSLAAPGCLLLALIKPQFEAGKGKLGKGGIVKDAALHEEICARLAGWLGALPGWQFLGITDSPIEGGDGNKEFLMAGRFDG